MTIFSCPECNKTTLIRKEGDYQTLYADRHGQTHLLVVPNLKWLECSACGESVLDTEALTTIDSARRKALGLLTPREIREIRIKLRKTQAGISELLGIGQKTYCRWESGTYVQSEASDRYLRLLMLNGENITLLKKISETKIAPSAHLEIDNIRDKFPNIKDARRVMEAAKPFVEMFMQGALQSV